MIDESENIKLTLIDIPNRKNIQVIPAMIRDCVINAHSEFMYLPNHINILIQKYAYDRCHQFAFVCASKLKHGLVTVHKLIDGKPQPEILHTAAVSSYDPLICFDAYGYVKPDSFVHRYGTVRVQSLKAKIIVSPEEIETIIKDIKILREFFNMYNIDYL